MDPDLSITSATSTVSSSSNATVSGNISYSHNSQPIWTTGGGSTGTTTIGGIGPNGWGTSSYSYDYLSFDSTSCNPISRLILSYLSEKELSNLLDSISKKNPTDSLYSETIKYIIKNRHCSEEFILKYLDISSIDVEELKSILKPMHFANIASGEYAQLALLVELN